MRIVEIRALDNGAHRNQSGMFVKIPDGWAKIPDDMHVPDSFPFVQIQAANGVVTAMTPMAVPDIDPPEPDPTPQDDIDALMVDHELRLTMLELGLTE